MNIRIVIGSDGVLVFVIVPVMPADRGVSMCWLGSTVSVTQGNADPFNITG